MITEINLLSKNNLFIYLFYNLSVTFPFLACTKLSKWTETVLQRLGFQACSYVGSLHCGGNKSCPINLTNVPLLPLLSLGKTKADKNIMDHPTLPEGRTKKTAFVLLSHKATNVNDPWPYLFLYCLAKYSVLSVAKAIMFLFCTRKHFWD